MMLQGRYRVDADMRAGVAFRVYEVALEFWRDELSICWP